MGILAMDDMAPGEFTFELGELGGPWGKSIAEKEEDRSGMRDSSALDVMMVMFFS
jgi:hypothetical protein